MWIGFDEPRSLKIPSAVGALPIWRRFVQDMTGGQIRGRFPKPAGVEEIEIDPVTRSLALADCPERQSEILPRRHTADEHLRGRRRQRAAARSAAWRSVRPIASPMGAASSSAGSSGTCERRAAGSRSASVALALLVGCAARADLRTRAGGAAASARNRRRGRRCAARVAAAGAPGPRLRREGTGAARAHELRARAPGRREQSVRVSARSPARRSRAAMARRRSSISSRPSCCSAPRIFGPPGSSHISSDCAAARCAQAAMHPARARCSRALRSSRRRCGTTAS